MRKGPLIPLGVFMLAIGMVLTACSTGDTEKSNPTMAMPPNPVVIPAGFANPELLVDTAWLDQHLDDDAVRVLDTRTSSSYEEGHVPGAVNVTTGQYTATVDGVPGMVTPQQEFAKVMENAGVSNDTHVVIVDAGNMLTASRLLWTLEYYGHQNVSILYGGQAAWLADGRDVNREEPVVGTTSFTVTPASSLVADLPEMLQRLDDPGLIVLDSRSPEEYAGENVRTQRGGHIPGAVNVDWTLHLVPGEVPTLKPPSELRELYEAAGFTRDKEVISYCQTGFRAAHGYLVLRLLGYDNRKVYDGSWVEWGNREDTPIEK